MYNGNAIVKLKRQVWTFLAIIKTKVPVKKPELFGTAFTGYGKTRQQTKPDFILVYLQPFLLKATLLQSEG